MQNKHNQIKPFHQSLHYLQAGRLRAHRISKTEEPLHPDETYIKSSRKQVIYIYNSINLSLLPTQREIVPEIIITSKSYRIILHYVT